MDEFLDDMDDEQVDDLLQPEEGEDKAPQLYEHFRFVADRGQSLLRVDKFLVDRMFGATRNRIQSAADAGCIMANGKPVKSNYRVKPEDVVTIMMTRPPRTFEILPENIPIKSCTKMTICWWSTNRQGWSCIPDTETIPARW